MLKAAAPLAGATGPGISPWGKPTATGHRYREPGWGYLEGSRVTR
jgi:hypothetical protein